MKCFEVTQTNARLCCVEWAEHARCACHLIGTVRLQAAQRMQGVRCIMHRVMLSLCSVPEVHCVSDALARVATVATTVFRALQAQPHRVSAVCSIAVHKQAASLRPLAASG